MGARAESEGHRGVHMVVSVARRNAELDSRNFEKYQFLGTLNPYLRIANRIVDQMIHHGEAVLTARKNGGPMIEVSINGMPIKTRAAISEESLGVAIRSFDPRRIKDTRRAKALTERIVRDGKAVVFRVTP